MKKRLVLHAGLQKCGSTTLQATLSQNRAALLARGIFYPDTRKFEDLVTRKTRKYGPEEEHGRFNHISLQKDLFAPSTAGANPTTSVVFAEILSEFKGTRSETLVVSAEGFLTSSEKIVASRLPAELTDWDINIVVFSRPYDDMVEAYYKQKVKDSKRSSNPFSAFFQKKGRDRVQSIPRKLAALRAVFPGAAEVHHLDFTTLGTVEIFKSVLGVADMDLALQPTLMSHRDGKLNVSLSVASTLFLKHVNEIGWSGDDFHVLKSILYQIDRDIAQRHPISLLRPEIRQRLTELRQRHIELFARSKVLANPHQTSPVRTPAAKPTRVAESLEPAIIEDIAATLIAAAPLSAIVPRLRQVMSQPAAIQAADDLMSAQRAPERIGRRGSRRRAMGQRRKLQPA